MAGSVQHVTCHWRGLVRAVLVVESMTRLATVTATALVRRARRAAHDATAGRLRRDSSLGSVAADR